MLRIIRECPYCRGDLFSPRGPLDSWKCEQCWEDVPRVELWLLALLGFCKVKRVINA